MPWQTRPDTGRKSHAAPLPLASTALTFQPLAVLAPWDHGPNSAARPCRWQKNGCPEPTAASTVKSVAVQLTILGSGSGGNCAYLETEQTRLLIDAGFSPRQIRLRLAQIGRAPENLHGILVTHEHTDHIAGLAGLAGKLGLPIYCNRATAEEVQRYHGMTFDCRLFTTGATFEIGDLVIETFSLPHDAQDPVGFVLRTLAGRIAFATDLGHFTRLVADRVRQARVLVLETNHDLRMLQECPHRPWSLKQRILSRHGHLSNEAAAEGFEQVVTEELQHLYLAHLSRDCNRPELALATLQQRIDRVGAKHVQVVVTSQDQPCAPLIL